MRASKKVLSTYGYRNQGGIIMAREIKFRGKTPQGEWLYGDLQQCNDGTVRIAVNNECWNDDGIQSSDYLKILEVNPDTVGQFTGLHDKNGKEIYEGDIVRTDVSRANATKNKTYRNFAIRYNAPHFWNGYDTFLMSEWRMEVIGNIHDNPELLKQK